MRTQPTSAIPPPELEQVIAPNQVWTHMSESQQQAIRQILTSIAQTILDCATTHIPEEESLDESEH
jgi:hypothetical protein